MTEKPMGVTTLCILAIFLGVMGVLGGITGLVGLIVNPKGTAAPSQDAKLAELNKQFEQKILEATKESRPVSLVLMPLVILSSGLLAAGGIAGYKLRGLGTLRLALAANLAVDIVGGVFGMIVQSKMMGIMKWYFQESASATNMPGGVATVMQFSLYTGLFFGTGWLVVKTVYYIIGIVYFGKRSVRDAFSGGGAVSSELPPTDGPAAGAS